MVDDDISLVLRSVLLPSQNGRNSNDDSTLSLEAFHAGQPYHSKIGIDWMIDETRVYKDTFWTILFSLLSLLVSKTLC